MMQPAAPLLFELESRGFIHQCTDRDGLAALLSRGPITGYIGFDLTADSLHVGSLVQIMMLRWMQTLGHQPIVVVGGGTTRIGDPSGRDSARPLLDAEAVAHNKACITAIFSRFLTFEDTQTGARLVDNTEWLDQLNYIDFMREIGRHFSVNRMVTAESVRTRLENTRPLSFLEFNYPLLQAYDFVMLNRRLGVRLQLGGSDQWGNIVAGVDLSRRLGGPPLFGLTSPLITTASGAKMGKTASGALWLNAERSSPYAYWQYWRNTADSDVPRFLKLFTMLPLDEIARLAALGGKERNAAKIILATEATARLHGRTTADTAEKTARQTFEAKLPGEGLPTLEVTRSDLVSGIGILVLCVRAGCADSNGAARRLVRNHGIRLNGAIVTSETHTVTDADIQPDGTIILSKGRKHHIRIVSPAAEAPR